MSAATATGSTLGCLTGQEIELWTPGGLVQSPVRGRIRRCTPAGIAFAQRAMAARPDSTGLLASIDVPALVIAGTQDAIVAAPEVGAMAGSIPGARYAELDCGHLSNLEIPRAFNQRLADFLAPARMPS